jgi:hypothetical protein
VLCLPRLTVLINIEIDRPGAWFPGPLGPYKDVFPGVYLSRDFERLTARTISSHAQCACLLSLHMRSEI